MNPCIWKAWHPTTVKTLTWKWHHHLKLTSYPQILDPISCQLRIIAEDQIFAPQNYLRNYNPPTVPRYSSYATVSKFGKKIFVDGDSHVKRIKRLNFNKELRNCKAFFRSFSEANSKQFNHYIIPTLVDDKPDFVLLHVGTNDILSKANNIINIGLNCKNMVLAKSSYHLYWQRKIRN